MIVESARSWCDEVCGFAALSGIQHANRIHLATEIVLGMRIRRHIVTSRIVVYEQHPAPGRHDQFLGTHAARRQGKRVRIGGIGWCDRRGSAAATRRQEKEQEQCEDCHPQSIIPGRALYSNPREA